MLSFDPTRTFRKLAYNNRLANHRLHQVCASLKPGEFEAERVSFFPSLKQTFNHILVVDWYYVDALEGGTLGAKAWENEAPCDTIEALATEQAHVDLRLVALCKNLKPETLASPVSLYRGNRIQTERMDDVLSHLFQHQTHHRGQIHAMLAGTNIKPPQLDEFITADDSGCRTADLAQLGWNEAMLMR